MQEPGTPLNTHGRLTVRKKPEPLSYREVMLLWKPQNKENSKMAYTETYINIMIVTLIMLLIN